MKIPLSLFLLMPLCLDLANALPVASPNHDRQQRNQRRATYSVVPVDGGTTTTATQGQTITRTVTQNFDSTTTITASPIAVDTTVVLTVAGGSITSASSLRSPISVVNPSQPTETVWVSKGPDPVSVSPSATMPISSIASTTQATPQPTTAPNIIPTMLSISSILVTSIVSSATCEQQPKSTSKSNDDGQWHTTYPSWNATSSTSMATGALFPTGYRR